MTALLSIFSPPKLQTTDYAHEAKYLLAYRMGLFLAITIAILDIVLFAYFDLVTACAALVAIGFIVWAVYRIRVTGRYFVPMLILNLVGAMCSLVTLFAVRDQPHIVDIVWMVINILFAFLVLGEKWGMLICMVHGVAITLFYLFFLEDQLELIRDMRPEQIYSTALNVFLGFAIISYLSWQNIKTNDLAKKQLNFAQEVLQDQYNIILKQNDEKTVMLKEIHHRVKNNLQIITSLLRLQARELENPEAIAKFKDATHRVIAMSMIHEKMYQSDHLSTLHMKEYLHDLSSDLVTSYQSGYPVSLHIECDVDSIGLRSIVPLALILNELISNSLKYAFDEYDNCLISISFMPHGNDECLLTYKDSGTWKAPARKDSFGLDLIESLTDQLEGTMTMHTFPETRFEFIFRPQED
jgi:two-component system, sensor histidine kinase PdtaS